MIGDPKKLYTWLKDNAEYIKTLDLTDITQEEVNQLASDKTRMNNLYNELSNKESGVSEYVNMDFNSFYDKFGGTTEQKAQEQPKSNYFLDQYNENFGQPQQPQQPNLVSTDKSVTKAKQVADIKDKQRQAKELEASTSGSHAPYSIEEQQRQTATQKAYGFNPEEKKPYILASDVDKIKNEYQRLNYLLDKGDLIPSDKKAVEKQLAGVEEKMLQLQNHGVSVIKPEMSIADKMANGLDASSAYEQTRLESEANTKYFQSKFDELDKEITKNSTGSEGAGAIELYKSLTAQPTPEELVDAGGNITKQYTQAESDFIQKVESDPKFQEALKAYDKLNEQKAYYGDSFQTESKIKNNQLAKQAEIDYKDKAGDPDGHSLLARSVYNTYYVTAEKFSSLFDYIQGASIDVFGKMIPTSLEAKTYNYLVENGKVTEANNFIRQNYEKEKRDIKALESEYADPSYYTKRLLEKNAIVDGYNLIIDDNNKVTGARDKDGYEILSFYNPKLVNAAKKFEANPKAFDVSMTSDAKQRAASMGTSISHIISDMIPMIAAGVASGGSTLATGAVVFAQLASNYYPEAVEKFGDANKAAQYTVARAGIESFIELGLGSLEQSVAKGIRGAISKNLDELAERFAQGKITQSGLNKETFKLFFGELKKQVKAENAEEILQQITGDIANYSTGRKEDVSSLRDYAEIIPLTTFSVIPVAGIIHIATANQFKTDVRRALDMPVKLNLALNNLVNNGVITKEKADEKKAFLSEILGKVTEAVHANPEKIIPELKKYLPLIKDLAVDITFEEKRLEAATTQVLRNKINNNLEKLNKRLEDLIGAKPDAFENEQKAQAEDKADINTDGGLLIPPSTVNNNGNELTFEMPEIGTIQSNEGVSDGVKEEDTRKLQVGQFVDYGGIKGKVVAEDDGIYVQDDKGDKTLIEGGLNEDATASDLGIKILGDPKKEKSGERSVNVNFDTNTITIDDQDHEFVKTNSTKSGEYTVTIKDKNGKEKTIRDKNIVGKILQEKVKYEAKNSGQSEADLIGELENAAREEGVQELGSKQRNIGTVSKQIQRRRRVENLRQLSKKKLEAIDNSKKKLDEIETELSEYAQILEDDVNSNKEYVNEQGGYFSVFDNGATVRSNNSPAKKQNTSFIKQALRNRIPKKVIKSIGNGNLERGQAIIKYLRDLSNKHDILQKQNTPTNIAKSNLEAFKLEAEAITIERQDSESSMRERVGSKKEETSGVVSETKSRDESTVVTDSTVSVTKPQVVVKPPAILTEETEEPQKEETGDKDLDNLLDVLNLSLEQQPTQTTENKTDRSVEVKYASGKLNSLIDSAVKLGKTNTARALRLLKEVLPTARKNGIKVFIHPDNGSMIAAQLNRNTVGSAGKGFYDPTNNEVHLNLEKITEDTPIHEVLHPIISAIAAKNKPAITNLVNQVKNDKELGKELVDFVSKKYNEDKSEEELVVTFLGNKLAEELKSDKPSNLAKRILQFFRDLLRDAGIGLRNTDILGTIKDNTPLSEFIKSLTDAIKGGYIDIGLNKENKKTEKTTLSPSELKAEEKKATNGIQSIFNSTLNFSLEEGTPNRTENINGFQILKKKFGETTAKAIRTHIPIALDFPNEFSEFLSKKIPAKGDINGVLELMGARIDSMFRAEAGKEAKAIKATKSPEELASLAEFEFHRPKNMGEVVASYRKDFKDGEVLCTITGFENSGSDRFKGYHIFWLRKYDAHTVKHANDLTQKYLKEDSVGARIWRGYLEAKGRKKEDGTYDLSNLKPARQDPYGTSSMSVQIDRKYGQISIKNRYNHTVNNPDDTFGGDLNSIVEGLHDAVYNINGIPKSQQTLQLPDGVVSDGQGRLGLADLEVNNVHYGENIILENGEIRVLDKNHERVVDGMLFNAKEKSIIDSFREKPIDKIKSIIFRDGEIEVKTENGDITIKTVKGKAVSVSGNITSIGDNFLSYNTSLTSLELPNVTSIGDDFLSYNTSLTSLELPNVTSIGDDFLYSNTSLTSLELPNVTSIGSYFLYHNTSLTSLELPNVTSIGYNFLSHNTSLTSLELPNVTSIGSYFLYRNTSLTSLELPNVTSIGSYFLYRNNSLTSLELPNVTRIGYGFLSYNTYLTSLELPNVTSIGDNFLSYNTSLTSLELPNVTSIEYNFLYSNTSLTSIELPNVTSIGDNFLSHNTSLTSLELPNVTSIGYNFLSHNTSLTSLELPNVTSIGDNFLPLNKNIDKSNLQFSKESDTDSIKFTLNIIQDQANAAFATNKANKPKATKENLKTLEDKLKQKLINALHLPSDYKFSKEEEDLILATAKSLTDYNDNQKSKAERLVKGRVDQSVIEKKAEELGTTVTKPDPAPWEQHTDELVKKLKDQGRFNISSALLTADDINNGKYPDILDNVLLHSYFLVADERRQYEADLLANMEKNPNISGLELEKQLQAVADATQDFNRIAQAYYLVAYYAGKNLGYLSGHRAYIIETANQILAKAKELMRGSTVTSNEKAQLEKLAGEYEKLQKDLQKVLKEQETTKEQYEKDIATIKANHESALKALKNSKVKGNTKIKTREDVIAFLRSNQSETVLKMSKDEKELSPEEKAEQDQIQRRKTILTLTKYVLDTSKSTDIEEINKEINKLIKDYGDKIPEVSILEHAKALAPYKATAVASTKREVDTKLREVKSSAKVYTTFLKMFEGKNKEETIKNANALTFKLNGLLHTIEKTTHLTEKDKASLEERDKNINTAKGLIEAFSKSENIEEKARLLADINDIIKLEYEKSLENTKYYESIKKTLTDWEESDIKDLNKAPIVEGLTPKRKTNRSDDVLAISREISRKKKHIYNIAKHIAQKEEDKATKSKFQKVKSKVGKTLDDVLFETSRTLMLTMDNSTFLTNGLAIGLNVLLKNGFTMSPEIAEVLGAGKEGLDSYHGGQVFALAFKNAYKAAWEALGNSEQFALDVHEALMNNGGRVFKEVYNLDLKTPFDPNNSEEYFQSSVATNIGKVMGSIKIGNTKIRGNVIQASEAHMVTFLNILKYMAFKHFYDANKTIANKEDLKMMAEAINQTAGTTQNETVKLLSDKVKLNTVFLAFKYAASKFLLANTILQGLADPIANLGLKGLSAYQKERFWMAARLIGGSAALVIGLTFLIGLTDSGDDEGRTSIDTDWRSRSFLKVRHGSDQYDFFFAGGVVRLAMAMANYMNSLFFSDPHSNYVTKNYENGMVTPVIDYIGGRVNTGWHMANELLTQLDFLGNKVNPLPPVSFSEDSWLKEHPNFTRALRSTLKSYYPLSARNIVIDYFGDTEFGGDDNDSEMIKGITTFIGGGVTAFGTKIKDPRVADIIWNNLYDTNKSLEIDKTSWLRVDDGKGADDKLKGHFHKQFKSLFMDHLGKVLLTEIKAKNEKKITQKYIDDYLKDKENFKKIEAEYVKMLTDTYGKENVVGLIKTLAKDRGLKLLNSDAGMDEDQKKAGGYLILPKELQ